MTSTSNPSPTALRLTARCPDDLIAVARLVLGFTPTDSVVMLTFGAAEPFHARVDLPARAAPRPELAELAELAELLLEPAVRHGASCVVLLVFTDDADLGAAVWAALRAGVREHRLPLVGALRVDSERWYPFSTGDARVRRAGVPYDVSAHPFVVHGVVEGRVTHGSRDQLAASLDPDPPRVMRVVECLFDLAQWPAADQVPRADLLREGRWVHHVVAAHVTAGTVASDAEVARLLLAVQLVRVRDAAWTLITRATASRHLAFWVDVLRRTPDSLAPPVATLAGWSAWQAGDGALAWCAVDRCTAVDPDYSLARLLAQVLGGALSPSEWDGGFDWTEGL